ncbi:hypothetical protein EVAR_17067_1 [Eumeta japonica]|uniref:Uncharacterized protein n=1 Tax=Eumeta variegata TaxID=151549 RepID=A0A4C1V575_EUMVA|nr:hypothetical protein EVAR_17067_1 [Eumeta japonica]
MTHQIRQGARKGRAGAGGGARRPRRTPPRIDTHLNTSSRLRLPPSDCLRPFSSRKQGEYRLSSLVPPVFEACITPATNRLLIRIMTFQLLGDIRGGSVACRPASLRPQPRRSPCDNNETNIVFLAPPTPAQTTPAPRAPLSSHVMNTVHKRKPHATVHCPLRSTQCIIAFNRGV